MKETIRYIQSIWCYEKSGGIYSFDITSTDLEDLAMRREKQIQQNLPTSELISLGRICKTIETYLPDTEEYVRGTDVFTNPYISGSLIEKINESKN